MLVAVCLCQLLAWAAPGDIACRGTVVDQENEPVIGATVATGGGKVLGVTDIEGRFSVNAPRGTRAIQITYVGFKPYEAAPQADMGTITLEPSAKMLNDVVVTMSLAKTRQTPVALSQINASEIEYKLGTQEFPEVLKTTPGVWTTRDGGGFGDAKTNMRGFKSANVAVLINGIPINDMEWGGVYWSNWAGLSDVASNIQTQRGLGASLLSAPSVGGTINITTRSLDAQRGGSVWYGMGSDGANQYGIKLSTGLMDNGWAVTVLGSRRWGDNFVQGTWYDAYNYFVNVSKKINDRHQLSFTAFGAPQEHAQRDSNNGLTIMGYQTLAKQYMNGESPYKYNPTYGFNLQGQVVNSKINTYHKPQLSLAHTWQIDDKSSLSTTIYASWARGGGSSGQGRGKYEGTSLSNQSWYGASNGQLTTLFRNPDGTFAYDKIQLMNIASTTGSNMVMSESNNSHNWYGLVSTYTRRLLEDRLVLTGGIDLRYYIGTHNNKITDLYSGQYYMDDSYRKNVKVINNAAAADPGFKYQKLGVGDIVYRDYDGKTLNEGAYVQGEYFMFDRRLSLVLSGSLSNTSYKRIDRFYYDKEHGTTPFYNFLGGTAKFGANYNIDRSNNAFFNVGYISRAPFFSQGVFVSKEMSNAVNPNPLNEKVVSFELGYGFHSPTFTATINGYYTKWLDKTNSRKATLTNGDLASFNMEGVDARHMGIEVNAVYMPARWITLEGMLSVADYEWDSNAKGYFYTLQGEPLASLDGTLASGMLAPDHAWAVINQKGVKVGGSAMITGSASVTFRPFKGMRLGADWVFNSANYSDYQLPSTMSPNDVVNVAKPWRIPWGNQVDLSASYSFDIAGINATIFGNVHNLCNYNYVMDAYTDIATEGTWENAYRVFYSPGRSYSIKLKLNF